MAKRKRKKLTRSGEFNLKKKKSVAGTHWLWWTWSTS